MKALSVRQPWAWLIVTGTKNIENRTWPTSLRGRIYIHAGRKPAYGATLLSSAYGKTWQVKANGISYDVPASKVGFGSIVGEVTIVDCVSWSRSPWFTGPYGFILEKPIVYSNAIPYPGKLGFFEVALN